MSSSTTEATAVTSPYTAALQRGGPDLRSWKASPNSNGTGVSRPSLLHGESSQLGDRTQVPHTADRFLFCFLVLSHFCISFFFILIGGYVLYNTVVGLPFIDMNQPWVYMRSPSWPSPHPFPIPSLRVIPLHQPWAPCLMQPTWTGILFHIW